MNGYERCATVTTCYASGVEAVPVDITARVGGEGPEGIFVNAPVQPTAHLRCALRACGFEVVGEHVEIDMSPDRFVDGGPYCGSQEFTLAMAIAYLVATGQVQDLPFPCVVTGDLGLDGSVTCRWNSYIASKLTRHSDARLVTGAFPVDALQARLELHSLSDLRREWPFEVPTSRRWESARETMGDDAFFFNSVILANPGCNVLLIGHDPDALHAAARWAGDHMPRPDERTREEAAEVYAAANLDPDPVLRGGAPIWRTSGLSSVAKLIGGGRPVSPGDVSMAHGGTLVLDDVEELSAPAATAIRGALDDGSVTLVRSGGIMSFPARFRLVGIASPCHCGHYGDPDAECTCSAGQVRSYRERLEKRVGKLFDRVLEI